MSPAKQEVDNRPQTKTPPSIAGLGLVFWDDAEARRLRGTARRVRAGV